MCTSGHTISSSQYELFDTVVLPILSYVCKVWGVDTKCNAATEALHQDFLRRLLGVRKSTANHMVSAELAAATRGGTEAELSDDKAAMSDGKDTAGNSTAAAARKASSTSDDGLDALCNNLTASTQQADNNC